MTDTTVGRPGPDTLTGRILAACVPGRSDEEVGRLCGCSRSYVVSTRILFGVPAGVGVGGRNQHTRTAVSPSAWSGCPMRCPSEWEGLAMSLGLSVSAYAYGQSPDFWVVKGLRRGRLVSLGTYVPKTGSCFVLGRLHPGLTDPADALALFAGVVDESVCRRRNSEEPECVRRT